MDYAKKNFKPAAVDSMETVQPFSSHEPGMSIAAEAPSLPAVPARNASKFKKVQAKLI